MILPPGGSNGDNNNTVDPRLRWRFHTIRLSKQLPAFSCNLNVFKASSNIKMLRIDFLDFELNGPINGTCTDERFVIMGENENDIIPELCGFNTGQHVYVDVSQVSKDSPIQFSILANTLQRRRFRIRICQIAENCPTLQNCLQYFTGLQGVISTFNYDQTAAYNRSYPGYLVSMQDKYKSKSIN
ncbi:uncharacterized protein LOC108741970 [Agrilus planipennis]|uniref:Uncharacterized protein LOC108741970 n=1 Tax=Agrilus planipennis TaxID=224129 RepID=A0A1W4XJ26_AGRPL|nr:uncharacterized protein LOC108741970 [Agrilus planipennis]